MSSVDKKKYQTFAEFWPFYLSQHASLKNRTLHFIGTIFVLALVLFTIVTQRWIYIGALPFVGYGFAWIGHFIVEKNRPATFTYPGWSLRGDFKMFLEMLCGKHWGS